MSLSAFRACVLRPALARGPPAREPIGFLTSAISDARRTRLRRAGGGNTACALGFLRAEAPAALGAALGAAGRGGPPGTAASLARLLAACQARADALHLGALPAGARAPGGGAPPRVGPPVLALARNPGSAQYRAVILDVLP